MKYWWSFFASILVNERKTEQTSNGDLTS